jgi:carboxyl-terminal processing protease
MFKNALPSGFAMVYLDSQWVCVKSSVDGLQRGDALVEVDGKPVEALYQEVSKYVQSGSDKASRGRFAGMLTFFVPDVYRVRYLDKVGVSHEVMVDKQRIVEKRKQNAHTTPALATEGKWLDQGQTAYIKIPSFGEPHFEEKALKYVKEFDTAAKMIIDVRENGGGNTPSRLTAALMDRPWRWWSESSPLQVGILKFLAERNQGDFGTYFRDASLLWNSRYTQPDSPIYQGKLLLLTDRWTGSAAEDFAMPFKDNGRAMLVGERTFGSTGQPYMYDFGGGLGVKIGTKRAYMPNGMPFEGIGIEPDVAVGVTRRDIYAGLDPVLEAALRPGRE